MVESVAERKLLVSRGVTLVEGYQQCLWDYSQGKLIVNGDERKRRSRAEHGTMSKK